MNSILQNARRRAVAYATNSSLQLHNNTLCCQSISTTTHLSLAMPMAKTSPEEARTAQKKVKKEKKGPSASKLAKESSAENKLYELQIKAFDAPGRDPPRASEEEMERRYHVGRDYVIGCFKRHNELNHDLAVKIRMKVSSIWKLVLMHMMCIFLLIIYYIIHSHNGLY